MWSSLWPGIALWLGCGGSEPGTSPPDGTDTGETSSPPATSDTATSPAPVCPPGDDPRLETTTGCVRGSIAPSGREQFLGIPFAEPPVGALRFAGTVPVAPWDAPLDATALGPPCVQFAQGPFNDFAVGEGSEDCLTLNVYRPAGARDLPVMFFVHGGGHTGGSASEPYLSDDPPLAEEAVLVTVQYRLGPLGYLAHPELSAADPDGVSGNQGLQDVITAFRWVADNLEALGGDPDRVVVFGESAGGLETCAVLASPRAADLPFDAAIVQSAPCSALGRPLRDPSILEVGGEAQGEAFAEALGCDGDLDCLREAPIARIVEVGQTEAGIGPGTEGWAWNPWIDGVWLPVPVAEALIAGEWNRVPVLATVNADEGTIFTVGQAPTQEALDAWIAAYALLLGVDEDALAAQYAPAAYDGSTEAAYAALFGDVAFLCPTVWQQELLSAQVEARGGSWVHAPLGEALGAFHASEVPYVFGTVAGDAADEALSAAMMDAWRSMADPEPAIDGPGSWPTVGDGWVELGLDGIAVVGPPGGGRCALFEGSRADPYPR